MLIVTISKSVVTMSNRGRTAEMNRTWTVKIASSAYSCRQAGPDFKQMTERRPTQKTAEIQHEHGKAPSVLLHTNFLACKSHVGSPSNSPKAKPVKYCRSMSADASHLP